MASSAARLLSPCACLPATLYWILVTGCWTQVTGYRLLAVDTQAGLDMTRKYYEELGKQNALLFSWVFVKDNLLLQINGDLPGEKAKEYKAALESLK